MVRGFDRDPRFKLWHREPYPTVGGIRFVLDQIGVRDPKAKTVAPESFMDLRFVKQLDDSGFIQGLYPKG